MSVVILVINPANPVGQRHHVTGADAQGNVTFSENEADAKQFADGAAATAFATGKKVFGAVQVTVSGLVHYGKKSCNQ